MDRLLQHQNSTVAFAKNHGSCAWGWLQFLDLQFHSPKLLEHGNHGDNSGKVKGLNSYAPLMDSDANFSKVNRGNARKRRSGKALIKALLSKKLFRKNYQKQRQLLRTISIHHLECNDYVQDEITSDGSSVDFSSLESDLFPNSEKVPFLSKGKMNEIGRATNIVNHVNHDHLEELDIHLTENPTMLANKSYKAQARRKQKESVPIESGRVMTLQLEDFVSNELLNAHREVLVKTIQDPNKILEDHSQESQTSDMERFLTRSGSYPGLVYSGRQNPQAFKLKHRVPNNTLINQKARSFKSSMMVDSLDLKSSDVGDRSADSISLPFSTYELRYQRDDGTPSDYPSPRLAHDKNEYRKEHMRISMDAVLHRVPYGQKVSEDSIATKLFRSASARSYRDDHKQKIAVPPGGHLDPSFQRSRSLIESLDRYSKIIGSISNKDPPKLPDKLIVPQEHGSLQDGTTIKSFGRIFSIPESQCNLSERDTQNVGPNELISPKATTCSLVNEDDVLESHDSMDKPANTIEVLEETTEDSNVADTLAADDWESYNGDLKWAENESEQDKFSAMASAKEDICNIPVAQQEVETNEQIKHHQNKIFEISDSAEVTNSLIDEKEIEDTDEPSNHLIEPILPTLHDKEINGSEIETVLHSEPDFSSVNQKEKMGAAILGWSQQQKNLADGDTFHIHVDQKDEAGFNYARKIMMRSSFGDLELLGASLDSSLLQWKSVAPSDEFDVDSNDSEDVTPDQQILFDIINEALLETYLNYFARSWFSRFDSRLRLSLAANLLHQEVWTKISRQLSLQTTQSYTLENIIAEDLSKDDRWLNLQFDAQDVGMELENLILDTLLHELLEEF